MRQRRRWTCWLGGVVLGWFLHRVVLEIPEVLVPHEELDEDEPEEDEDEVEYLVTRPVRYGCHRCETMMDPAHVWSMESEGTNHEHVYITYHCPCQVADSHLMGRYPFYAEAVLFVAQDPASIRNLVSGGWRWENSVKLRYATPDDPQVMEFTEALGHTTTVDDILRLGGG